MTSKTNWYVEPEEEEVKKKPTTNEGSADRTKKRDINKSESSLSDKSESGSVSSKSDHSPSISSIESERAKIKRTLATASPEVNQAFEPDENVYAEIGAEKSVQEDPSSIYIEITRL